MSLVHHALKINFLLAFHVEEKDRSTIESTEKKLDVITVQGKDLKMNV
jgi:hypothetical protein